MPAVSNSTVRIATLSSHPATGDAKPTVPQYIPRRYRSHCEINWRARSLGVPVTEAGGKAASSSADIGSSSGTRADTVDTRCHTPGAGRTTNSSGTVTVPVTATRPRSLRTRSTIMMFSATSLADARSADGGASSGSVPLIGLDVTTDPRRRRNSSGDSDATAPHGPATKADRDGAVRPNPSMKKSSGDPVTVPANWVHTHA
ncbi:Uncharacterised protein [Mycobacterium tuberculosis]|uniref:Uncharacterized protein n=1 Tax=Mycobacterium tuberculosis TaxID=1773 RepID=A0A0U0T7R1_MYCTX|nr:Uncharacterised protein [Mycobacterium tuberculosis]COX53301.1 Uncharacterised protein [Mycobacterium tuberculosis]